MLVSDAPDLPLVDLDDKTLLALSRHWGKVGQVAFRRFLATLPEIARRGLYRRARCHSIYEYAAKFANTSKEVVDTVFLVHRRIGTYEVLWSLFVQGKTGLTFFRRISAHVTAANAAWWAQIVQTCSIREIERILKGLEGPGKSDEAGRRSGQIALSPGAGSATVSHGGATSAALPGREAASATGPSASYSAAMGPHEAGEGQEALGTPVAPEALVAPESQVERVDRDGEGPLENQDRSDRGQAQASGRDAFRATPLAAQIAENLVAEYRRRGLTVSVAEVIEAALKHVAIGGLLPAIGGQEPSPREGSVTSLAKPKRSRLPKVLVSLPEIGMTFLRTLGGLIPLTQREAEAFDSGSPPITYPGLLAVASAVGVRASGRAIPAAVKLAVFIRAAGRCEAGTCTNPIEEFDHLDPYSETPVHLPARMAGLCPVCHKAHHNGLVENPQDPPEKWRIIGIGKPRSSSAVDRQVQARRQAARNAVLLPPKAG